MTTRTPPSSVNQPTDKLPHKRMPGLDTLRALAIIFVICHHYKSASSHWLWLDYIAPVFHVLWSGVDLFFVLSGFLIASQWFVSIEKDKTPWSFAKFYLKRCFRILPTYWIVLALYVAQVVFLTHHDFKLWTYLLFVQNLVALPIFDMSWSLCVEEHFYLIFPSLILGLRFLRKKIFIYSSFAGGLFLTVYLRDYFWNQSVVETLQELPTQAQNSVTMHAFLDTIYYPTYCRLDGLIFGVGLAAMKHYQSNLWKALQRHHHLLSLIGLILWVISLKVVSHRYEWSGAVPGFLLLAFSFSILVFVATNPESWLGRVSVPGFRKISDLSYAMYLIANGVFTLMSALVKRIPWIEQDPFFFFLHFVVLIIISQILFSWVETPFLKMRHRLLKTLEPKWN